MNKTTDILSTEKGRNFLNTSREKGCALIPSRRADGRAPCMESPAREIGCLSALLPSCHHGGAIMTLFHIRHRLHKCSHGGFTLDFDISFEGFATIQITTDVRFVRDGSADLKRGHRAHSTELDTRIHLGILVFRHTPL